MYSFFSSKSLVAIFCDYLTAQQLQEMQASGELGVIAENLGQTQTQQRVRQLLDCVKHAEYARMDGIMLLEPRREDDWRLMTYPIEHTLADGTEEIISPLRYAAKIYETYARAQLWTYVPEDNRRFFLEQVRDQKEHLDNLDPLARVCNEFVELDEGWQLGKLTPKDLEIFLETKHGKEMQRLALDARHLTNTMICSSEWKKNAKFNDPTPPAPDKCVVFDYRLGSEAKSVPLTEVIPDLGKTCTLMRGQQQAGCVGGVGISKRPDPDIVQTVIETLFYDLTVLGMCLEARKKDLAKDVLLLDAPAAPGHTKK